MGKYFWVVAASLVLSILILALGSGEALASIHQYPEGDRQVMHRSLQTLRDREDHAWQIVLFKRVRTGQVTDFHLRLVGFPKVTEFSHPHALPITAGTGKTWVMDDVPVPYPANVGEYDVRSLMADLDSNSPLTLTLPVKDHEIELVIPPFVVQEWRRVKDL